MQSGIWTTELPVKEQRTRATKKGAHTVSVGGGATSTSQSVSLLFAQMRPDRKTKRPLSREKPMIWARKVALPKLHAWNGLVGRNPEKKMGDRPRAR